MKIIYSFACMALCGAFGLAQAPNGADPLFEDGVSFILKTFDRYPIVGVTDIHGNWEEAAFYEKILADPRLPQTADTIVLESTSLWQPLVDSYVAGADISDTAIRQVWRNDIDYFVGDTPLSGSILRIVRRVNLGLPKDRQLKVLLAEPPIDWRQVQTTDDYLQILATRDQFSSVRIEHEVLSKGHKALVIYGAGHMIKNGAQASALPSSFALIEQRNPGKTYVVWTHTGFGPSTDSIEPKLGTVASGSIAPVRGTWLGRLDVQAILMSESGFFGGQPAPLLMEDGADAFLWLGPVGSLNTAIPYPVVYRDQRFWRELKRRWRIYNNAQPLDPYDWNFQYYTRFSGPGIISGIKHPQPPVPQPPSGIGQQYLYRPAAEEEQQ